MLKKNHSKTGRYCRVTFKLPKDVDAKKVSLCADFNDWDPKAHPMKRLKNGGFSTTVSLRAGQSYRFRYCLDNRQWKNDAEADAYEPNKFGSENSVLHL